MNNAKIRIVKQGFTFVELFVFFAVIAIVIGITLSSSTWFSEWNKERETRDLLVNSIYTAKLQAQNSGVHVYLCATNDGVRCAEHWESDWIVYEDTDGSATLSPDDIITDNISTQSHLIKSGAAQVHFSPTGHSSANTFYICSNKNHTIAYQIILSRLGRISYVSASGGC